MNSADKSNVNTNNYVLDDEYSPHPDEPFMNERQLAFFAHKLNLWRTELLNESKETLSQLQVGPIKEADLNDRASSESDWGLELRTRDRQRKLVAKIDAALRRIENGEFGYCVVTGEPISLARLKARPIATMTLEAQEKHERRERISRDN
ncbi:RNA polymerase-binding protein DksA [Sphingorhabdus lutea]|uniref:RNA polymerase-binding transcription factor DksA n=1 Tax=Sphingorhabdus lutea TaxID=1913578 RepID=A0A1L3JB32_9SPHN|nr:RNA polymerase-binding protein DksA [Sphingorhabdus lutea]APG62347.1 RNA polymerase-binding protein DksA [Sphingorhabdus lutea]